MVVVGDVNMVTQPATAGNYLDQRYTYTTSYYRPAAWEHEGGGGDRAASRAARLGSLCPWNAGYGPVYDSSLPP